MTYKIWTDGSAKKNGKYGAAGGFAYAVVVGDEIVRTCALGPFSNVTNQQMELMAAIEGCNYVTRNATDEFECFIYSDSAYLVNCYIQNWYVNWEKNGWLNSKKEPVANKELWEQLIPYFKSNNFHFVKVKGHADDEINNLVDKAAQNAAGG